ncbi:TetR/AcrR family transcriptional regulator [Bartonella apis]|uniref:Transcriptional regulator, TetR family n=1 Tax=Bartonella apis TaxID=1686310 RepID=A0A1R0FCJ0_9HYPH|nr:TetR/AcrR family transcriptional regulator [Bartonella apis]MCT6824245.1 TetR/AcrR family transcriptional regulator [Bartonella apis]MCT6860849.1 TetR/AcrR family transcriptional regulator [Bartonella apis]OLY44713.1 transcriptional regulator, TetR family [Bartonella apis]
MVKEIKPRKTRLESQQETRQNLLEAALMLFTELGYETTSIRGICDKAGYSQGAFYSNFNNKSEVLLELLEQYKSFEANSRKQLIDDAGDNFEKALNDMILWFERNDQNISHTILLLEMQLHALRHPEFVKIYNNLMDEQKSFYTKLVQHLFTMRNIEPPFDCSIVAEGLMALGANEAIARRLNPKRKKQNPFSAYLKLIFRIEEK